MKYEVLFGVDHGVSKGFGPQYPDYTEIRKTIRADSPKKAMDTVVRMAARFGFDYVCNPDTRKTMVEVKNIQDSTGNSVIQRDFVAQNLRNKINDNGNFTISYTPEQKFIAEYFGVYKEE